MPQTPPATRMRKLVSTCITTGFSARRARPKVVGLDGSPDFARGGPSPSDADVLMHRVHRDPSIDIVELFEAMQLIAED